MKDIIELIAGNCISVFIVNALFTFLFIKCFLYARGMHLEGNDNNEFMMVLCMACAGIVAVLTVSQFSSFQNIESAFAGIFAGIFIPLFYPLLFKVCRGNNNSLIKVIVIGGAILIPIILWVYYTWWASILSLVSLFIISSIALSPASYGEHNRYRKHEASYDDEISVIENLREEYDKRKDIWPDI